MDNAFKQQTTAKNQDGTSVNINVIVQLDYQCEETNKLTKDIEDFLQEKTHKTKKGTRYMRETEPKRFLDKQRRVTTVTIGCPERECIYNFSGEYQET
jgi:hypothetical protein